MEMLAELHFQSLKCENLLTSNIDCFREGRGHVQIVWFLRKEQDTGFYKVLSAWPNVKGGIIDGFWSGVTLQDREGGGSRLILPLFWGEICFSFRKRILAVKAKKEGGAPCSSPVLGEQGHCSLWLWWSSLPTAQFNFSFSHYLRKEFLCWVSLCMHWGWWTDSMWQYSYNCRKNRKNGTLFSGYSVLIHDLLGMLKY